MTLFARPLRSCLACAALIAWPVLISAQTQEPRPADSSTAEPSPLELAALQAEAVQAAVDRVRGALVQVRAIGAYRALGRNASGASTGVLLDQRWVVTSSFGMETRPEVLVVVLPGGGTRSAALVSMDHSRQTALLRLAEEANLALPSLEPRSEPRPGETAIGVGAAYSAESPNVSVGIVSAVNRRFGRAVQTDAAVSPANYGGLLIDLRGRVLGVLCPAGQEGDPAGGAEWYDSGIGFAVPLEHVLARLPRMQQGEDIHAGRLGLSLAKGHEFLKRPIVSGLAPTGPADQAGLEKDDAITAVDGLKVATQKQFRIAMGPRDAGDDITLTVQRGEQQLTLEVKLVAASDLPEPQQRGPLNEGAKLLERLKDNLPQPE